MKKKMGMKVNLGGSRGKAWEFDGVKRIVIHSPYPGKSFVGIDVEMESETVYKVGFSEAGTIRIDNKKAAQS